MSEEIGLLNLKDVEKKDCSLAILPWGTSEPHNYHLPYLTDCILANEIAKESVSMCKNNSLMGILPYIWMGAQNPGQTDNDFCIHFDYTTQEAILMNIVRDLRKQGFRKLVIINGHMGNDFKPMIRDIENIYDNFLIFVANWLDIKSLPHEDYFEFPEDHAGEVETSAMLYYHPELVKLDQAGEGKAGGFCIKELNEKVAWTPRDWNRVSEDTGMAYPMKSTKEKGERYCKLVCKEIANLLDNLIEIPDIY